MSTAAAPAPAAGSNLFTRNDTVFGVCEGLGQDLGFNPMYLRIAFAAPLIFNPPLVIGAYLATGVVVFASRMLFPARIRQGRRAKAEAAVAAAQPALPAAADDNEEAMAVAA